MTHLLIDSDSLCYKAGFSANEPDEEAIAVWQLDRLVKDILETLQPSSYQLYLSGPTNFRFAIYPDYKGNRKATARPVHLQALRARLVEAWGACISDGNEADDAICIAEYASEDHTTICHIDKDLNMIAGHHYNYNTRVAYSVSDQQAMKNFFKQLVMGDKVDNIPGFDGKMRDKVPKKLEWIMRIIDEEPSSVALETIGNMYGSWEDLHLSASCLWLQRKEDDHWLNYQNPTTVKSLMEVLGQKDDGTHSSLQFSAVVPEDGPPSSNA